MASRRIEVQILGDDRQLSRTFGHAGHSARGFERDIGKASRGALAGSGAFRSMGRSLAFASGAFVGVASITAALRASVDAAEAFGKASRGLSAQLKANGQDASTFTPLIERTNASMAQLGITAVDSETALSRLTRATGDVGKGAKLMGLTADLAAARQLSLAQSSIIVGKVVQGTTTAFNRYGLVLKKGTSIQDAVRIATAKFAGQAAAAVTPLAKLHAGVNLLEIAVGEALLPTINRIAVSLTKWISNSANVARVQRDVQGAVKVATAAFKAARAVIGPLVGAFQKFARAVGGTTHAFEVLFALGIAAKLRGIAIGLGVAEGAGLAGGATRAAGAVRGLARAMAIFQASVAIGGIRGAVAGLGTLGTTAIRTGLAFRVGLAGAVVFAGFELSKLIRKIPGWDSALQSFGGTLENILSKSKGARLVLGISGPVASTQSLGSGATIASAAIKDAAAAFSRNLKTGVDAEKLTATIRARFHLDDHDARVFIAAASRRLSQGLSVSVAVNDSPQRAVAVAAGAAAASDPRRRRRPTSLQGLFNLDELRLADAQRRNQVKLQRAILVDEEHLTLKLRDQAKTLKERTKFAQQAAQIEDQIRSIDQQSAADAKAARDKALAAAKARKEALKRAAELARAFTVPLRAQLAEAKAAATKGNKDDLAAARAIKRLAEKALKSGRLGLQGQIDAWNTITAENQTIADLLKKKAKDLTTAFRKFNPTKDLRALGLTPEQVRAVRARLSQVGPGGTVPGTGSGAFGFALAGGGTTVIPLQVNLDGHKIAQVTTRHQQRRERRNPRQKRGPHAR